MNQELQDELQDMMLQWSQKLQDIVVALSEFAEACRQIMHEPVMKLMEIFTQNGDYIEFQSLPTLIELLRDYRQQLREATNAKDRQLLDRAIIMMQFAHRGVEPHKTNAREWLEKAGIRYREDE